MSPLTFYSFTIITVSALVSSAESVLSIADWSLLGGAVDRMQFFFVCLLFCCFFFWGGGGAYMLMAFAAT